MINDVYSAISRPVLLATPSVQTSKESPVVVQSVDAAEKVARQDMAAAGQKSPQKDAEVKSEASLADINDTVDKLRDHVKSLDRELEFSVDEDSGRTVITVRDPETDEVLRQIPPDELLYVVKALQENSANLFVEAKA